LSYFSYYTILDFSLGLDFAACLLGLELSSAGSFSFFGVYLFFGGFVTASFCLGTCFFFFFFSLKDS